MYKTVTLTVQIEVVDDETTNEDLQYLQNEFNAHLLEFNQGNIFVTGVTGMEVTDGDS